MHIWCPYVVGRDAELDALRQRLAAAHKTRGGVTFISGPPGVGKSRLVREMAEVARGDGIPALIGRAVPTSGPVAYRPVAEIVAQALRGRRTPDDPDLTPWLPALRAMLPGLDAGPARAQPAETAPTPHVCGEALIHLLRWLGAGRGTLLVFEDLGWADPDTLALVEYLADNLLEESVLCLCTVRPEAHSAAWDLARRTSQRGVANLTPLMPLHDDAVATMVRACVPDAGDDLVARIQATADGIPLTVEELLASPGVPETVDEAVRQRVGDLASDDAAVLFAAAVLGRDFDWELLPTITGLPTETVIAALERLARALLIRVDGDGFRFRHALTREAVVGSIVPPRRAALARAALAAADQLRPGHDLADLALQAGDHARAAVLLAESGRRALRRGALATAAATLGRAADLCRDPAARAPIQATLVTALAHAGRLDEALAAGQELLGRLGTGGAAATVHLDLARAAVAATQWPIATTHLDAANRVLAARPDPRRSAEASALASEVAIAAGDLDQARQSAEAALATAESLAAPEIACHALELVGRSHRVHDLAAARAAFARALAKAEQADLPVWRMRALHELGTIDLLDHAGTEALIAARERAEQLGAHSVTAVLNVQLAAAYTTRSELDAARTAARRAVALSRRLRLVKVYAMALVFDANVSMLRGDRRELDDMIAEALRAVPDDAEIEGLVASLRGMVELLWGDRNAAVGLIDSAIDRLTTIPTAAPAPVWGLRALLHAVQRRPDARESIEQVRRYGATTSRLNRGYLGYAEAALSGSAEAVGSADIDLAHFPVWHRVGRALLAEAALAGGWGEPHAWLRDARECFQAHGLHHLAGACARMLGEAPQRTPAGLTNRETEVLTLVEAGLANREIAGRLHLSVRTVEKHVESLLRKTGARSRTHLVAMLRKST